VKHCYPRYARSIPFVVRSIRRKRLSDGILARLVEYEPFTWCGEEVHGALLVLTCKGQSTEESGDFSALQGDFHNMK
jgi:hypothetical protein